MKSRIVRWAGFIMHIREIIGYSTSVRKPEVEVRLRELDVNGNKI
jgi:hypothetical protein